MSYADIADEVGRHKSTISISSPAMETYLNTVEFVLKNVTRNAECSENMEPVALSLWWGNSLKSMTQVSQKDVDAKAALLRADKAIIDLLQYRLFALA